MVNKTNNILFLFIIFKPALLGLLFVVCNSQIKPGNNRLAGELQAFYRQITGVLTSSKAQVCCPFAPATACPEPPAAGDGPPANLSTSFQHFKNEKFSIEILLIFIAVRLLKHDRVYTKKTPVYGKQRIILSRF